MIGIHSGARVRHTSGAIGTVTLLKINQTAIVKTDDGGSLVCHVSELVNTLDEPRREERRQAVAVVAVTKPKAIDTDDITDPFFGIGNFVDRNLFGWMDG